MLWLSTLWAHADALSAIHVFLLPPTRIFNVAILMRASFVVHSNFDVSVGIQQYENDVPLLQGFESLGMRALA